MDLLSDPVTRNSWRKVEVERATHEENLQKMSPTSPWTGTHKEEESQVTKEDLGVLSQGGNEDSSVCACVRACVRACEHACVSE